MTARLRAGLRRLEAHVGGVWAPMAWAIQGALQACGEDPADDDEEEGDAEDRGSGGGEEEYGSDEGDLDADADGDEGVAGVLREARAQSSARMQFGMHRGRRIADLPGDYVAWMCREPGFFDSRPANLDLLWELERLGMVCKLGPGRVKCLVRGWEEGDVAWA